ncbi:MAG: cytochrome oxidase [Burkholderiaceae bacterium]|jgi:cytochrome c oxidase subunit 2|nr:MAG: cytochrome oxidase [Burkholderiaceae bacterium]
MTPQGSVWIISLVFIGMVAVIFLFTISGGGRFANAAEKDHVERRMELIRVGFFSAMMIALIFVTFFTLVRFPIPPQQGSLGASQVIVAVGRQWNWELSSNQIEVGKPVEFEVTSDDVNHGFAIYDPEGELVTQVQAMPDVTNKLLYTFTKPGTYHVLCLEYCGVGHPTMRADIHVVAAATQGGQSK